MTAPTLAQAPSQPAIMTLTPAFKMVLLSLFALTVLSMLVTCYLITVGGPPMWITVGGETRENPEYGQWRALMTTFESTFKFGFGMIAGLIGGKVS